MHDQIVKYNFTRENPDLVSVIIPVHNRFEMANRAITSVINQSYRPIEILVIDDSSEEIFQYPEAPQKNKGIHLEIIRTKKNMGPGVARETGKLLCKGNYVVYLDSDDKYLPDFIKNMVCYLKENPNTDMVYCHAKYMSPDGIISDESVKKTSKEYKQILPYLITHGRPWHTSACIRRRSLTDRIGPWENFWFWEDYDYDARAGLINNNIGYISDVLCYIDKENTIKITKSPDSSKKTRSYGMSICNIARNIDKSDYDRSDVRKRVIYHLLKSAARNIDDGHYRIAQTNLHELLNWVVIYKRTYILVHILCICNSLKLGSLVSRGLRRISKEYRFET